MTGHQIAGDHYESLTPEPFEVIDAWGLDFYRASALKYIARAGRKPGVDAATDLRKAAHYLTEAANRAESVSTRPAPVTASSSFEEQCAWLDKAWVNWPVGHAKLIRFSGDFDATRQSMEGVPGYCDQCGASCVLVDERWWHGATAEHIGPFWNVSLAKDGSALGRFDTRSGEWLT